MMFRNRFQILIVIIYVFPTYVLLKHGQEKVGGLHLSWYEIRSTRSHKIHSSKELSRTLDDSATLT